MAVELTTVDTDTFDPAADYVWFHDTSPAITELNRTLGSDFFGGNLSQIRALADPNADRLLFWDDSAGAMAFLTLGTNLTITGTTLDASGGGGVTGMAGDGTDITASPAAAGSFIIQQAATPTDNILKIFTSAAANIFSIEASGRINITERIIGSGSGNFIQWGDTQFGDVLGTGDAAVNVNSAKAFKVRDNAAAINLQVDSSSTAGQTRMLVYDVDNATLERVTVGAADSGGSGFKVLRIPN